MMAEIDAQASWPSREAYDEAMLDWAHTLHDDELRQGQLQADSFGIIRYGGAGLYVCVYRIDNWLVRCFRDHPPADIRERYVAIERFCLDHAETCSPLIPITYQPDGINVRGRWWPVVKMPFFQRTPSLGKYIERHHDDPAKMRDLAAAWLRMIREMEQAHMAHGDLDLTNVLVEERGGQPLLRLIDYDNLWIPALAQRKQTEHGHEHFQHPATLPPHERPYVEEMDRFASLVIYLSLLALEHDSTLYERWQADESTYLLLLRSDYQRADRIDGRIAHLSHIPELAPYVDALRASLRTGIMPPSVIQLAGGLASAQPIIALPPLPVQRPHRAPVSLRPALMHFPDEGGSRSTGVSGALPPASHQTPMPDPLRAAAQAQQNASGSMPRSVMFGAQGSQPPTRAQQVPIGFSGLGMVAASLPPAASVAPDTRGWLSRLWNLFRSPGRH